MLDFPAFRWPGQVLLAQRRDLPQWWVSNVLHAAGTEMLQAFVPLGTAYATDFLPWTRPLPVLHFPYGYDVMPDVH